MRRWGEGSGRLAAGALDALAELAWPTRCAGCNAPGELLCKRCRDALPWIEQRWACPLCGAPYGWLACTECGRTMEGAVWPTRAVICCFPFEGVAATLPATLKDAHETRLAKVMAAALACALDEAAPWPAADGGARFDARSVDALCYVPATARAYARRGFDHMELVCRALAPIVGVPVQDVLVRRAGRDQRELGREARAANLRGSTRVMGNVGGLRMLLVDDVVTTGASVRESARALLAAGAASVTACAIARVWQ